MEVGLGVKTVGFGVDVGVGSGDGSANKSHWD